MSRRGAHAGARPSKTCVACGRRIEWRRKWQRDWDAVRYCGRACRQRGVRDVDRQLEQAILTLLHGREPGATVCPSEAARRVAGQDEWRALLEPVRRAARRLAADGRLEITQRGRVVDPSAARGPIRLRLPARAAAAVQFACASRGSS